MHIEKSINKARIIGKQSKNKGKNKGQRKAGEIRIPREQAFPETLI
jgi:hypothetical protein